MSSSANRKNIDEVKDQEIPAEVPYQIPIKSSKNKNINLNDTQTKEILLKIALNAEQLEKMLYNDNIDNNKKFIKFPIDSTSNEEITGVRINLFNLCVIIFFMVFVVVGIGVSVLAFIVKIYFLLIGGVIFIAAGIVVAGCQEKYLDIVLDKSSGTGYKEEAKVFRCRNKQEINLQNAVFFYSYFYSMRRKLKKQWKTFYYCKIFLCCKNIEDQAILAFDYDIKNEKEKNDIFDAVGFLNYLLCK